MYIMHTIYLPRVQLMLIYIPKIHHGLCSLISLHLSPSYMLMIVCMYFSVTNMYPDYYCRPDYYTGICSNTQSLSTHEDFVS